MTDLNVTHVVTERIKGYHNKKCLKIDCKGRYKIPYYMPK